MNGSLDNNVYLILFLFKLYRRSISHKISFLPPGSFSYQLSVHTHGQLYLSHSLVLLLWPWEAVSFISVITGGSAGRSFHSHPPVDFFLMTFSSAVTRDMLSVIFSERLLVSCPASTTFITADENSLGFYHSSSLGLP